MVRNLIAVALAALSVSVFAKQPSAPPDVAAPIRNLTWGQLNFLHTTDTHGWLAGHLQEPSFSADWGDYISFANHMRQIAEANGVDLLVIDTGDRVDGNGLYDASEPKGKYVADIFKEQEVDVLCSGNHELYEQSTSEHEFLTFIPNFKGRYLASNIDIIDPETNKLVPLAQRYKKFTTKEQGIRIVAFGFLFDFTGNYNNTVVQPVGETVKEAWFQEAIREKDVDLFLVIGHVMVESKEYNTIFKAIREVKWDTPIQFFGGHRHIRDYVKYDSKSYGLASGRLMETIGFMSIDGLSTKDKSIPAISASPTFNRRYIDNNLFSLHYHTGLDESIFPTEHGENVSRMIEDARSTLELDTIIGCAPKDLWMSRAKYPSDDSIYSWLVDTVLPEAFAAESRESKYGLAVFNSGGIRFDIFKGPFTKDTISILSPFLNSFRYVKDVPYEKANQIVEVLNTQDQVLMDSPIASHLQGSHALAPPERMAVYHDAAYKDYERNSVDQLNEDKAHSDQVSLSNRDTSKPSLIPGYTTRDDAGDDGDDTEHYPISFYNVPNCVQAFIPLSRPSSPSDSNSEVHSNDEDTPELVDLIYISFLEPWIDVAAQVVGLDLDVEQDAEEYVSSTLGNIIADWIGENWQCDKEEVRIEL